MNSIPPPPGNGPWRLLILSRDPDDPAWMIASVALADDIRPAVLDNATGNGRYTDWPGVCAWTAARLGHAVELTPVRGVLAWTVRRPR